MVCNISVLLVWLTFSNAYLSAEGPPCLFLEPLELRGRVDPPPSIVNGAGSLSGRSKSIVRGPNGTLETL